MIHLRLIVPTTLLAAAMEHLGAAPGVAHVVHLRGATCIPPGEVVLCDVVRESADAVIEWLQDQGVHRDGAIVVESLDAVVSDAAARADASAPGLAADALVWEEIEAKARADAELSVSFLVFMVVAAVIAAVGILLDALIPIVGAMVVGPEYAPLSALCVAAVRTRWAASLRAARTLVIGLGAAAAGVFVAVLLFRALDIAPDVYDLDDRELTAFISRPDELAFIVAVLAGIVGMLSLTEGRSGALVGVLVSVTTIPAAANVGLAAAYREWGDARGAALQLLLNLVGLVVAGVATLLVQDRMTAARRRPARARDA